MKLQHRNEHYAVATKNHNPHSLTHLRVGPATIFLGRLLACHGNAIDAIAMIGNKGVTISALAR
jgi:hypothetical protein